MQRKFLKNLALLLILNLLIKPFWILGIDRAVQNTVGATEYGFYFALLNFSFLFNILLDFGVTNFNNKHIAQHNQLLQKYMSGILSLKFVFLGLYFVVSFSSALIIGYSYKQLSLLLLLGFNQFLVSLVLYLRSNLSGMHFFTSVSLISVLDRAIMIVICGVLLYTPVQRHFRIEYFVYAQTVAYLITALASLLLLLYKSHIRWIRLHWNLPFFILLIRQSLPFALLALLMAFYNRIDSVMLERLLEDGARQSGVYASAYRLLDAANMIAYLFAVLLLPIFARMLKQKEPVGPLIKLASVLLLSPALIVAIGSFFYASELMHLLYPAHPAESSWMFEQRMLESAKVFGVLMSCFVAISGMYIFSTLLTANGNLKQLNRIALGGMVVNILLNLLLIPRFQAYGAAMASLVTQFGIVALQIIWVMRIFHFGKNWNLLFRFLIFIGLVIAFNMLSKQLPLLWYWSFGLMVLCSVAGALVLRLVKPRYLLQVLRFDESYPTGGS